MDSVKLICIQVNICESTLFLSVSTLVLSMPTFDTSQTGMDPYSFGSYYHTVGTFLLHVWSDASVRNSS
eukprot:SAG22_NODE_2654_length_2333_cov_207.686213_6_plen_69_part_00